MYVLSTSDGKCVNQIKLDALTDGESFAGLFYGITVMCPLAGQ